MTRSAPRRPTILVVDDSPGVLQHLEYLLAPHVTVVTAESGEQALRAVTADTALVLTDVHMPGMGGVDLARQLRRAHPLLPVVFMTGGVEADLRVQAQELDVLDVLRKPLRPGVLFPALQGWLARQPPRPDRDPVVAASQRAGARDTSGRASAGPASPGGALLPEWPRQQAQVLVAGLLALPGVTAVCAFNGRGEPLTSQEVLGVQVGSYLRFLLTAAQTLAPHLRVLAPLKAAQLEFQERVLVVCPSQDGFVAVLVRDTSGASSVKAWMRRRAG
ncbi:response regulator [Deinococcus radiotolerans]|uniref:Transcriptional regulator n=1 Tax=Deinococcus radiotolerans TaxID=1309407 RepID=A0ABQ2FMW5_9DEIO|nr:response regulator [Deinococcus radiotolerans]GGL06936.1 transcriptional regulator [Deinococcus radiotolerans]